jgi:hypothetical protein
MSTRAERKRRLTKKHTIPPKDAAAQEQLDREGSRRLAEEGFSPLDIEIASTTQKIIRTDSHDRSQADAILAAATPEVRKGVLKHFRTNEKLQTLFPEFAAMFEVVN